MISVYLDGAWAIDVGDLLTESEREAIESRPAGVLVRLWSDGLAYRTEGVGNARLSVRVPGVFERALRRWSRGDLDLGQPAPLADWWVNA